MFMNILKYLDATEILMPQFFAVQFFIPLNKTDIEALSTILSVFIVLQIFNDKVLRINAKRCVHMAIKLRKKYFYKVSLLLLRLHFGPRILSLCCVPGIVFLHYNCDNWVEAGLSNPKSVNIYTKY